MIGNSGVTVATGVDLGQQSEQELRAHGVSEKLIAKLRPYLGQKLDAAQAILAAKGLTITEDEAKSLDKAVREIQVGNIRQRYDAAVAATGGKTKFDDLPSEVKTIVVSTSYQMGAGYGVTSNRSNRRQLWSALVAQDADKIEQSLRRLGEDSDEKAYNQNRRKSEADYLAAKRREKAAATKSGT